VPHISVLTNLFTYRYVFNKCTSTEFGCKYAVGQPAPISLNLVKDHWCSANWFGSVFTS